LTRIRDSGRGFTPTPPEHPLDIAVAHRANATAHIAYRDKLISQTCNGYPEKTKEIMDRYAAMAAEALKSYPSRITKWREWVAAHPHHKDFRWSEMRQHGSKTKYEHMIKTRYMKQQKQLAEKEKQKQKQNE
jgi:hypothetical protein